MKAERTRRALSRVGRAVQAAVERFVLVGETIADDNPDIKLDMYESCREARNAGKIWYNFIKPLMWLSMGKLGYQIT